MCKLIKFMRKFYICTQILHGNALFSGRIYTSGNFFTRLPVVTVVSSFKSVDKEIDKDKTGEEEKQTRTAPVPGPSPTVWVTTGNHRDYSHGVLTI